MVDITIKVDLPRSIDDICPRCMGLGLIPAMQMMVTYDAGSIRGPDTWIPCPRCKGTGHLKGV